MTVEKLINALMMRSYCRVGNVHTHLDLTGAYGLTPPQPNFSAWLNSAIVAYRRSRTPSQVRDDIAARVQMLIIVRHHFSW